ncbi:siderophore-interacting protein [Croceicoccus bisphenolivorans]|uniref:siderophore-interacting protein n=1 Tax=Croceicoccus bisphenolivorans TaxID=1783232 RepID=UPI000833246C|nr:siderophore-interacting protein [Croceicoccus bisphenolivorans]
MEKNEKTSTPVEARAPRPAPAAYTVLSRKRLTPNMLRITLGGTAMAKLAPDCEGGYFKLRFPDGGEGKAPVRSYTIRHQRPDSVDVDFVVHGEGGHAGPAVEWASVAAPGDEIEAGGPGPAKRLPEGMDRYLIAGDMTALPAIAVNLERLPADARGIAVIEVQTEDDIQPIAHPDGIDLRWLLNPHPGTRPDLLAEALREAVGASAAGGSGKIYGWAASEFASMQALRTYLRDECGLDRDHLYVSSYWKYGADDDGHRAAKQADAALAG